MIASGPLNTFSRRCRHPETCTDWNTARDRPNNVTVGLSPFVACSSETAWGDASAYYFSSRAHLIRLYASLFDPLKRPIPRDLKSSNLHVSNQLLARVEKQL